MCSLGLTPIRYSSKKEAVIENHYLQEKKLKHTIYNFKLGNIFKVLFGTASSMDLLSKMF